MRCFIGLLGSGRKIDGRKMAEPAVPRSVEESYFCHQSFCPSALPASFDLSRLVAYLLVLFMTIDGVIFGFVPWSVQRRKGLLPKTRAALANWSSGMPLMAG